MLCFCSKIKEKVVISQSGNNEQKIFFSASNPKFAQLHCLTIRHQLFILISQKQVGIIIQIQKVFSPNKLDDLLDRIIGSRNMHTVFILSHIFF